MASTLKGFAFLSFVFFLSLFLKESKSFSLNIYSLQHSNAGENKPSINEIKIMHKRFRSQTWPDWDGINRPSLQLACVKFEGEKKKEEEKKRKETLAPSTRNIPAKEEEENKKGSKNAEPSFWKENTCDVFWKMQVTCWGRERERGEVKYLNRILCLSESRLYE